MVTQLLVHGLRNVGAEVANVAGQCVLPRHTECAQIDLTLMTRLVIKLIAVCCCADAIDM